MHNIALNMLSIMCFNLMVGSNSFKVKLDDVLLEAIAFNPDGLDHQLGRTYSSCTHPKHGKHAIDHSGR